MIRVALAVSAALFVAVVLSGPARSAAPPVGTVTNYTGAGLSEPSGITLGPDGALWFTNINFGGIGRITTDGVVSMVTGGGMANPAWIVAAPDGALWYSNQNWMTGNASIGRITTAGVVSDYTDPTISHPVGIARGPDGALWFTNYGNNSVGRITTAGVVSNYVGPGIDVPYGMTVGPDGALWFVNIIGNSIGRITTDGVVSNYIDPTINGPVTIAAGPDGALWFSNLFNDSIGRITTDGVVTNFTDPSIRGPYGIAAGPDGGMWFANSHSNSIGRIQALGATADTVTPVLSLPADLVVEASGPGGSVATYAASATDNVDPAPVVVCSPASGTRFPLGTTTVMCTATDTSGNSATGSFTVTVVDTTPPVLGVPTDKVVDATGPGGATVAYTATATDVVDPAPAVVCSPPSGTVFAIGTTTVSCTAADGSGNSSHGSFTITVKGAGEQLADLAAAVKGVGPGKSLAATVETAQWFLSHGQPKAACLTLTAFQLEVRAQSGKKIPAAQAAVLIADAKRIENVLGCTT